MARSGSYRRRNRGIRTWRWSNEEVELGDAKAFVVSSDGQSGQADQNNVEEEDFEIAQRQCACDRIS